MNDHSHFQFQVEGSVHVQHPATRREDVLERLLDFFDLEEALAWLSVAQPRLGGKTPDALISEGPEGYKRVSEQVAELEARIYL